MTPRVELTIDELVLDGVSEPGETSELVAAELRRQLGRDESARLGTRIEPAAAAIAKAAGGGVQR